MDQEPHPGRASLKDLLASNQSWAVSEQSLRNVWQSLREMVHYHLVDHPVLGEMGQSAVLIFAALFLLSSSAGILNGRYWAMRETLAHEEFERARGLNAQGLHEKALRHLRAAFHLEHKNREYQMALTLTLIQLERYDEARIQLDDILRADPTNAPANLLLARIAAAGGASSMDSAIQYYQRAIYGLWPDDPIRHRIDTRFEFAHFLASEERIEELRAELIILASDIRDDLGQLINAGYLMLFARSPAQAETVFTRALGRDPRNAEALAGLGKAQLEDGNFAASEQTLLRAVRANPRNEEIRKQLALVQEIRALNPKRRGIGPLVSARRAMHLLERTHDRLTACADQASLPPEAREDLAAAAAQLEVRHRGRPTPNSIDGDIALAVRLFHDGSDFCANPGADLAVEHLTRVLAVEQ